MREAIFYVQFIKIKKMKKIIMFFLAALLFVACTGNGNKTARVENSNIELDSISDSLRLKVENNTVDVDVKVVYPTNNESIKKDLMELVKLTGQGDDFDGYADSVKIDTTDMKSLVEYLLKSKAEWVKINIEGLPDDTPAYYTFELSVMDETDNFITMAVIEDEMAGSPHPFRNVYGITYVKANGKKIGTSDLESSKTDDLKKELESKVKTYFTELTKGDDVNIDEILLKENDEQIDYPVNGIYLLSDSVVFAYQTDEIAPYAFGMPDIKMSLKYMKDKGWLGKTLSDIVK